MNGYLVDKDELLRKADIIIGATGNFGISDDEFLKLKDNIILASASSRRVEFDIDSLSRLAVKKIQITPLVALYRLKNDKRIYLLCDGYPINFKHMHLGALEDLLFTMHYEAIRTILEENLKPGLHELARSREIEIAERWLRYYAKF